LVPHRAGDAGRVRFVVVAARRTGSNLLCTLLDSHPAILCHHELFNPRGIFCALSVRQGTFDLGSLERRDEDPTAFLDRVWREPRGHACVGFKMTCGQAEPVLEHVLRDSGVRKIVLRRRNRVKTWVSEQVAERLGQWEVYDETQLAAARPRLEIDVRDLREHVARNEAFYRQVEASLSESCQEFRRIWYEDLWSPEERARLLDFLEASPTDTDLAPRSVKQNPRDLREVVANFDEVAEALRGDPLREELLDLEN
jgi:LPS sulfotransferase NodH